MLELPALLPRPRNLVALDDTPITMPKEVGVNGPWADVVARILEPGTGVRVVPREGGLVVVREDALAEGGFILVREEPLPEGGYRLRIDADGVEIAAAGPDGVIAAVVTLRQLLPDWVHGLAPLPGAELTLPAVEIEDAPRYPWRGLHLDVSRHFMPLPFLYRYVDLLVAHKMNRFHLHLTDDQGWRFPVSKYPLLTTVGAVRPETKYPTEEQGDGTPHGGFYTQDQLRALVGYAKDRGVTIVPEIDLPGHVRALLAAYPEFGESGGAGVAVTNGIFDEVLHLTDETMTMVYDVLTELLDVFDSPWIHIGGDECPKTQWRGSDAARELAEQRGLDSVDQLQDWFTDQLHAWLSERGRQLLGWDELVEDRDVPGAVIMNWRERELALKALAAGNEVIMANWRETYFDHYSSDGADEPLAQYTAVTLSQVAGFDPAAGVPEDQAERILGVQGQIWTEFIASPAHVEYLLFPRAAALAEVGWAGSADYAELEPRLRRHLGRLDSAGVNYRPLDGAHPWQKAGTGRNRRPADSYDQ